MNEQRSTGTGDAARRRARRPLPAPWGWHRTDEAFSALARNMASAERGRSIAVVEHREWRVFKGEAMFTIVAGDIADSPEAARDAAEDACWERGLFGDAPAAQPDDPPWRWGAVSLRDGRDLYGRFREEPWCGDAYRLVVDVLQRDGSFKRTIFALALFEVEAPMAETEVREMVMARHDKACEMFTEPSALAGRCAICGHDKAAHNTRATKEAEEKRRRRAQYAIANVLCIILGSPYTPTLTWTSDEPGALVCAVKSCRGSVTRKEWLAFEEAGAPVVPWEQTAAGKAET